MTAPEPDRRCQCPTGVDCLVTQVLGGADQCMHEATAEDLLCGICRDAAGKCSRISYNGTWMPCHSGPLEFQFNVRLLLPC
jgi:hypothetical protein